MASNSAIKTDKGGQPDPLTYLLESLSSLLSGTNFKDNNNVSFAPDKTYGPSGMQITTPTQRLAGDYNQFMMGQTPTPNPMMHSTPEQAALGQVLQMAMTPDTPTPATPPPVAPDMRPPLPTHKPQTKRRSK
jgi:hypothetical protein